MAQYIELYSMSGDPADIEQFVDFNYTHTILTVQYQASSISEINEIKDKIEKLNEQSKFHPVIGGYSLVDKEMSESLVTGQIYSLLFAFVAIFLLISIIFKSIPAGFMGSLPLVFAVFCIFGLMGWLGIELNMVTALLSSISIGLGVDFTIQVFWRIKWELAHGNSYTDSVMTAIKTIGRGIIINAFAVYVNEQIMHLLKIFSVVFRIVRIRRHRHQPPKPHMRKPGDLSGKRSCVEGMKGMNQVWGGSVKLLADFLFAE